MKLVCKKEYLYITFSYFLDTDTPESIIDQLSENHEFDPDQIFIIYEKIKEIVAKANQYVK